MQDSELRVQPGHELALPDSVGVFTDPDAMANDPRFQQAMQKLEGDNRYTPEALAARRLQRAAQKAASAAGGSSGSSSTAMSAPPAPANAGEPVPDVISFGFCKLVFEFLQALKVRFHQRKMIAKTYEMFWQIAERAPAMPYETFRDLIYNVGREQVEQEHTEPDDVDAPRVRKQVAKAKAAGDDDEVRRLFAQRTLALFERRQKRREALPSDETAVSIEDSAALFDAFEAPILRHAMQVSLFRLAKLDKVWCAKLDLQTRDRICQFLERLCKVTDLINNFDPEMKAMINAVSLDSLKAVQGKDKRQIDVNALLDELQERILSNDEFLDKISEIAMKQAQ